MTPDTLKSLKYKNFWFVAMNKHQKLMIRKILIDK